jgi:hypothetical protein
VHDDEELYRRVPNQPINFGDAVNDEIRVSSAAFGDRSRRPSVDRAWLRSYDPSMTQWEATDCVVGLITREVHKIIDVSPRVVNVSPDPIENHETLPDNPAHALVVTDQAFDNDSQFKRLKRALARLSTCLITPGSQR